MAVVMLVETTGFIVETRDEYYSLAYPIRLQNYNYTTFCAYITRRCNNKTYHH